MSKIVCFGEIMLRLNPTGNLRFLQANLFQTSYAGSEVNVAVSLSNFGLDTAFVTKVPNNELGQASINAIRKYGVNTSFMFRGGDRLGIYFVEKGAAQRPSKVIYDRKNSSFANAENRDFDWDQIFYDSEWFHFSGITPALGDNIVEICLEACQEAKKRNIRISCDLNYRKNLWDIDKASSVMMNLVEYIDVLVGNEEDAEKVLGIKANSNHDKFDKLDVKSYKVAAKELVEKYGFKTVAFTLRESVSADHNFWSGILYLENKFFESKKYDIDIVDRLGAGDSFAASLIYAIIRKKSPQDIIDFAVAASCLKHSIEYDFNLCSVDEVEALLKGDNLGRIKR